MIPTLCFSLKISITAISFYWRNDTPSIVTWRSILATSPDTPMCIIIHGGQFTDGIHPPNQFDPEIVSPLPCSSYITVLCFQRSHFFHWLPRQMSYQRFQRFNFMLNSFEPLKQGSTLCNTPVLKGLDTTSETFRPVCYFPV